MKIAYIVSDIDKAVFFEKTAIALRNEGLDVFYIVINYENGAFVQFLKANGFPYHTIKSRKLSQSIPHILRVKRILKEEKIQLVHCHLAQANWIGLWGAYLAKTPHRTFTRHSGEPLKLTWKERIIDHVQNRLATNIIAISKVIDELLEKQKIPQFKRTIIHHGFELDRFSANDSSEIIRLRDQYNPNRNSPVIGVIARWMEWKGIHDVIEAFVLLLEDKPNAILCLFGATGLGDYHEELSHRLHAVPTRNLRIVPFEQNVFDLYRLFDVYVHVPVNSSCEAFGQTYVEALAARVPSVFTLSGIAQEFVVDRKHALVVPFSSPNKIKDAILELLNDEHLCEQLKSNGQEVVTELFEFSVYQKKLLQYYQSFDESATYRKIVYVISDVKRAVYFEQTAMALRNINFEVIFVLISCKDSPLDHFLIENNFQRYYLHTDKLLNSRKAIWKLRKILKYERPEIVHCHLAKANWVGLIAARFSGIKNRFYTRHSGKPLTQNWKEQFIDRIQNKLATHIIAISNNIISILQEQRVSPDKLSLIHHGFQLERFQNNNQSEVERIQNQYNPDSMKPVIGVISRWMELKGIDYIVDAFVEILSDYPNALLCIFGDSTDSSYATELRKKLNQIPEKNLSIVNFENNCFDLYQLFNIYIHTPVNSTCEAFGQTYIEAIASGIPSIFTLSGVSPEFIEDRKNALVVPFMDSKAIEQAIREILTNQELSSRLGVSGRKDLEAQFGMKYYIDNLSNLYHKKIGVESIHNLPN